MEEKKDSPRSSFGGVGENLAADAPGKGGEDKKEQNPALEEGGRMSEKKKIKNYISVIILLVGLLVGSVFVDVAQFFGHQGVSPRVLKDMDVFPFEGKTWVSYNEPVANVQIITDSKCEACDPTEPLKWLKRVVPTLLAKKIEIDSPEGKSLTEKFKIKSLPAFVFDENITKTDVYAQAQDIFAKEDGSYLMNTEQVGIKPGKYLETPKVSKDDAQVGPEEAKVKVVLFSDFQCPYCKTFEDTFNKVIAEYKDKALFVYKHYPLDFHKQAMNAAVAAECAKEQGKFWPMADKLFTSQADWQNTEGLAKFKTYATPLGLNAAQFNQCVDENKPKDKIAADQEEAANFGISGTPAFFVNDQFFGGVVSYDEIKKTIDGELAK